MIFTKRCAQCGAQFTRLGCARGQFEFIGRVLGGLTCFILFGGTSKYCPNCREAMKAQKYQAEDGAPQIKLDKGPLFRVVWFVVAIGIIYLLLSAA